MRSPTLKATLAVRSGMLTLCAALVLTASLTGAAKKQRPIKRLSIDPSAPVVELFEGIEQGALEATLIPHDSMGGNVFIENKTNKPISVKFPKAVAARQVLRQGFGGGGRGAGGAGGGMGGMGGGGMGGMGGMGGGQMMGGGMGGMGGGMMGGMGGMGGGMMGGMGGGFMSIPPARTVQVPLTTVCLNHGKPEPRAKMTYQLVKLEEYTSDPALQELLIMVGSGKLDNNKAAAQAATWNLTDKMSWEKLRDKQIEQFAGLPPEPYFSDAQLQAAQQIVAQAQGLAREREKKQENDESRSRNRVPETKN